MSVKSRFWLMSLVPALAFFLVGAGPSRAADGSAGTLVKGSSAAVYFLGADGKRYVFPNERVYFSWYQDFDAVTVITDEELSALPIGGNVTYKPGLHLVKITTDPKVYAVSGKGVLRWVASEQAAESIYGAEWSRYVHDIPDAFFVNYTLGDPIESTGDFVPDEETRRFSGIGEMLGLVAAASKPVDVLTLSHADGSSFSWGMGFKAGDGFRLVWSLDENPTYPGRKGDMFAYFDDPTVRGGDIVPNLGAGDYHVRVCEYSAGRCLRYSNEVTVPFDSDSIGAVGYTGNIALTYEGNNFFRWSMDGSKADGFYLVWAKGSSPTHPESDGVYYGGAAARSGYAGIDSGTFFVRVCEYKQGECLRYSNQLAVVRSSR